MIADNSKIIDFFRWFSAFVVVISHARRLTFLDHADVSNSNILIKVFYFVTGFGHQAVMIFFVLSGFLVAGSLLNQSELSSYNLKKYSINRFSRIYPPLFGALLLTALITFLVNTILGDPWLYNDLSNNNHYSKLQTTSYDLVTFLGNLLALQTVYVSEYGYNIPLWSLANEIWYYIWFPLILLLFKPNENFLKKLFFGILIISLFWFIGFNITFYFLIWLIGASLNFLPTYSSLAYKYLSWITFFIVLFISRINYFEWNIEIYDLLISVSFCFVLLTNIEGFDIKNRFLAKINKAFADFSYSLYLIHYPVIILIATYCSKRFDYGFNVAPNLTSILYFTILVLFSTIMAYLFSLLTEKNSKYLRKYLYTYLK